MSKIDDLIKEHCPDGVEFTALNTLLDYAQPTKYIAKSTKYDEGFSTPILTAGDSFILGYTNETDGVYNAGKKNPVIIFDDFTTSFHWVDFNFKVRSSAMKMITPKDGVNFKYVYYAMKNIQYTPSSHARHWISKYSNFEIPFPPLPVQQEIVTILDKFTKLEAELETELEARQRQYAYYRDSLLSFDEIGGIVERESVRWRVLGEVGEFIHGGDSFYLRKEDLLNSGVGCIHYGEIYTHYGLYAYQTKSFIPESIARKLKKAKKRDLIITTAGRSGQSIGKAVAWLGDEEIVTSNHACIYRHSLNPRYVAHFFMTNEFQRQKKQCVVGSLSRHLYIKDMSKIKIPIPPPEEQVRIADILDKFEVLTNDAKSGIAAGLAARQQQYEHYRNFLFKPLVSQEGATTFDTRNDDTMTTLENEQLELDI